MAINDEIFKNLEVYGGGTSNERVYNFLGSLGFTGTINDRLSKFEEEDRKGWQGLIRAWGQYTPAQVFSQGQQGVWFEPKPIVAGQQVLYQDSSGTTPVTADGDPVGLMLDRSRGLVLGPELVTNGTFDTDLGGWSVSSGWVWDSGKARDESASNAGLGQVLSYTPGARHVIEFDIDDIAGGSPSVQWPSGTVQQTYSSNGHKRLIIKAPSSTGSELVFIGNAATFTIDNVTVRELPGNHATQSTSAARPVYRTDGALHWLQFDGVDDALRTAIITPEINIAQIFAGFKVASDTGAIQFIANMAGTAADSLWLRSEGNYTEVRYYNGGGLVSATHSALSTPRTNIITGLYNHPSPSIALRSDGVEIMENTAGDGVGRFEGGVLSLGAQSNADTRYLNGNIYGLSLRFGESLSSSSVSSSERYLAKLAGVTL